MCNIECINFGQKYLNSENITGKKVLEVGSRYVGGTLSEDAKKLNPLEYIGCDIVKGKCVDLICSVEDIVSTFGKETFDTVINTEMLEHVKDWKLAINNMKDVLKLNGHIILTTRSKGFKKHDFPYDFWRFEVEDIKKIFGDFEILALEKDMKAPGVFIYAKKITKNILDLKDISVFSMEI